MPHTPGHAGPAGGVPQFGPGFQQMPGYGLTYLAEIMNSQGMSWDQFGIGNMGDLYDYWQLWQDWQTSLSEGTQDQWMENNPDFNNTLGPIMSGWMEMYGFGEGTWYEQGGVGGNYAGVVYDPEWDWTGGPSSGYWGMDDDPDSPTYGEAIWIDATQGDWGGVNFWFGQGSGLPPGAGSTGTYYGGGAVGGSGDLGTGSFFQGGGLGNTQMDWANRGMNTDCEEHGPYYNTQGQCIACCGILASPPEDLPGSGGGSIPGGPPMQQGPPKYGGGPPGAGGGTVPGLAPTPRATGQNMAGPGNVGQAISLFDQVANADRGPNTLANRVKRRR